MADSSSDVNSVYMIFNVDMLFRSIEKYLRCACGGSVNMSVNRILGLGCKVNIFCSKCENTKTFENCTKLGQKNNIYSINRQVTYAMRCIGQGFLGLKVFCGLMNLPPPVKQTTYDIINRHILSATSEVAIESAHKAAEEEARLTNSRDISVSCDGTWLTRGHSSQLGVCTVIGAKSGKVLDTEVLSLSCKSCQRWQNKTDTIQHTEWWEIHENECNINHSGSAGSMEAEGMKRIFCRSVGTHNLRYVNYIGDGDTKSFKAVSASKPYGPDIIIRKIECVGHVQKRMGTQLRKLKKEMAGKKLSDGKPIGGKNRLTDAVINTLTVYYGNAIRSNCNSVDDMRAAIWAIWHHKKSTDSEPVHNFCPKGSDCWCPYQRAVHEGTESQYHHKNNIAPAIMDTIKPVFITLVATELLRRCIGGHTQNNNESLNSKILKICPKTGFAGRRIVNIAVNDAIMTFNDGMKARIKVLKKLGIVPGENCHMVMKEFDEKRVRSANKRTAESTKEARRCRKRLRLEEEAKKTNEEGPVYGAGEF